MSGITKENFDAAPFGEEGFKAVAADCRVCGAEIFVLADWGVDGVYICSTGMRPRCTHVKCGDKFPHDAKRMATPGEVAMRVMQFEMARSMRCGVGATSIVDAFFEANNPSDFACAVNASAQLSKIVGGAA